MSAEVSFDSSSIQMLLLIGLIIVVGIYFYYENFKLKSKIYEMELNLSKLNEFIFSNEKKENINTNNVENNINYQNELIEEENIYTQVEDIQQQDIQQQDIQQQDIHTHEENIQDCDTKTLENNRDWINIHEQMNSINDVTKDVDESKVLDEEIDTAIDTELDINDILKDISLDGDKKEEIKDINYSKMTVSQLKNILIEKNLPVSGNKTKLIQRILDNSE